MSSVTDLKSGAIRAAVIALLLALAPACSKSDAAKTDAKSDEA